MGRDKELYQERTPRDVQYSVAAYDPGETYAADNIRFIDQLGDDSCYSTCFKYTMHGSLNETVMLAQNIANELYANEHGRHRYEFHGQNTVYFYVMEMHTNRQVLCVRIENHVEHFDPSAEVNRDISVIVSGVEKLAQAFAKEMAERVVRNKVCRVTWKFKSDGHTAQKVVMLDNVQPALTEFYPWLNTSDKPARTINDYFDSYIASSSNILLLLGEPGTGKTSFIRYLAYLKSMSTMITYDEAVLASDGFFVDFLSDDEHNMLVIEDSETILTDREHAGNKVMSKLLNVSEGLIKVVNKKIIFTANIVDIDKVDRALVRPGRAFDVMLFRPLTFDEAQVAAKAANLPVPTINKEYTLAELFNKEESESVVRNVDRARKTGFGFTGS